MKWFRKLLGLNDPDARIEGLLEQAVKEYEERNYVATANLVIEAAKLQDQMGKYDWPMGMCYIALICYRSHGMTLSDLMDGPFPALQAQILSLQSVGRKVTILDESRFNATFKTFMEIANNWPLDGFILEDWPLNRRAVSPENIIWMNLASREHDSFEKTINSLSEQAKSGNRDGLNELEKFIRTNAPNVASCEFYVPGIRVYGDPYREAAEARSKIISISKGAGLFSNVKSAQTEIGILHLTDDLEGVLLEIRDASGNTQARMFELLFAQMTINAKYQERSDAKQSSPDTNA